MEIAKSVELWHVRRKEVEEECVVGRCKGGVGDVGDEGGGGVGGVSSSHYCWENMFCMSY